MRRVIVAIALLALLPGAAPLVGTPKRTVLQQIEVPGSSYVTIVALTELTPGMIAERHTHPGTEMTYVMEGGGEMVIQGRAPFRVAPGDHWSVPAGTPHSLRNGPAATRLLVTYVLEKGKPLAIPAPE
jgi:quercetin dioxygenase-like cupin family protein